MHSAALTWHQLCGCPRQNLGQRYPHINQYHTWLLPNLLSVGSNKTISAAISVCLYLFLPVNMEYWQFSVSSDLAKHTSISIARESVVSRALCFDNRREEGSETGLECVSRLHPSMKYPTSTMCTPVVVFTYFWTFCSRPLQVHEDQQIYTVGVGQTSQRLTECKNRRVC